MRKLTTLKNSLNRWLLWVSSGLIALTPTLCFAAKTGKINSISSIITGVEWVVIVFIAIAFVRCVMSRNIVGIIISLLVGCIGIYFIINPSWIVDFGAQYGPGIGKMFSN